MTDDDRHRRRSRGQAEVPPIALITRAGGIAADARVLTDTEVAPLILTCTQAACGVRRRLGSTAEVIDCSSADPGEVDLTVVLNRLAERGLGRVLTEGGPTLLGAIVAEDLLDELCLTVAPVLTAGDAVRVAAGPRGVHPDAPGARHHRRRGFSQPVRPRPVTRSATGQSGMAPSGRYCGAHASAWSGDNRIQRGLRGTGAADRVRALVGGRPAVRHRFRT